MNTVSKNLNPDFWREILVPMFRQEFRKITASAGHAITTSVATAVVLALFTYIFGDFFKEKLPEINADLAARALSHLITFTVVFTSFVVSHYAVNKVRDPENWLGLMSFWGVNRRLIVSYRKFLAAIINLSSLTIVSVLLDQFLGVLSWWQWALVPTLTVIGVVRYDFDLMISPRADQSSAHSGQDFSQGPLIAWRKSRIANSSWNGSSLRLISAIPIVFGTIAVLLGQHVEVGYLSSLVGGILLSWTVPLLIDDDLQTTWIERQAAVSHEDWMASWQRIFTGWALRMFVMTSIGYTVTLIASQLLSTAEEFKIAHIVSTLLINSLLAAFPVWLAPAFVMQIDGKKSATNIIMLTLVGIFAGSVVMAAPVAAPVLYLLHREAHRYQGGRFARGAYR